jgi:hypothetical protein
MPRIAPGTRRIPVRRLALFVTATLIGVLMGLQVSPLRKAPMLTVGEHTGQLIIAWTLLAPSVAGRLEIDDGTSTTTIPIYAYLSGVTYARRTNDVRIRLTYGKQEHFARFLSREEATPAELSAELESLTAEAHSARIATERGLWRISRIQHTADQLLALALR